MNDYRGQYGTPWWAWGGAICCCLFGIGVIIWLAILTSEIHHVADQVATPAVAGIAQVAATGIGVAAAAQAVKQPVAAVLSSNSRLDQAVQAARAGNQASGGSGVHAVSGDIASRWARVGAKKKQ